jgi:hypothetical protein
MNVKDVIFLDDTQGLILISNSPSNKSSIYYFNITMKSNPVFTLLMALSSSHQSMIIEPFSKLWCFYCNEDRRFSMGKISSNGKIENGQPIVIYN